MMNSRYENIGSGPGTTRRLEREGKLGAANRDFYRAILDPDRLNDYVGTRQVLRREGFLATKAERRAERRRKAAEHVEALRVARRKAEQERSEKLGLYDVVLVRRDRTGFLPKIITRKQHAQRLSRPKGLKHAWQRKAAAFTTLRGLINPNPQA